MAQLFPPAANVLAKASLAGVLLLLGAAGWVSYAWERSPYTTQVHVAKQQPVPFSHKHHVADVGLDCRACHTSVETSSFAGIPPIHTCMTCHSVIWKNADMLRPIREAYEPGGKAVAWQRVNAVPQFVYFDHSIHVNKGVGCYTCHGPVDQMPLTWRENTLQMEWCLECHREPENFLRPKSKVFDMNWRAPENQIELGKSLVEEYHVKKDQLTNCWVCHR